MTSFMLFSKTEPRMSFDNLFLVQKLYAFENFQN